MSEGKVYCPMRTVVRLGLNHGLGLYRVAVGEAIFTGKTESEAVASAVMDILKTRGTATISITPPL